MKHIMIIGNVVIFQGRSYPIYFVPKEEFPFKPWKARGYVSKGIIYIREGTWLGLEKLIIHEIGHILGYNHTWCPYLMHPSWIGRWFWKWNKNADI